MSDNNTVVEKVQTKKRRTSDVPKVSVALKRLWKLEGQGMSLKAFARSKKGEALVKRWFENRKGLHDAKRSDKNGSMARLCAEATKNARRARASKKK